MRTRGASRLRCDGLGAAVVPSIGLTLKLCIFAKGSVITTFGSFLAIFWSQTNASWILSSIELH